MTTEIVFRPLHWEDASKKDENFAVPIRVWGLNREGKSVCLRIESFPAFYFVELPKRVQGRDISWTNERAVESIKSLAKKFANFDPDSIIDIHYCTPEILYYFKKNPYVPMVRICFRSMKAANFFAGRLNFDQYIPNVGKAKLLVHEKDIPICLKLQTALDVKVCQWLRVKGYLVAPEQAKSTSLEYIAEPRDIAGIPMTETITWEFNPKIMAVDGEMYSDNPRVVPSRYIANHVVFMWSCVYKNLLSKETFRKCIVMGECDDIPPERLENAEIIRVKTEVELVRAYAQIVREVDPDIVFGFNIYSFDNPYLNFRVERELEDLPVFGRIKGENATFYEKTWNSRAYGDMYEGNILMTGRIVIDLLNYFKREFKLQRYNLDTVAKKFLGETKHDVSPAQMFDVYGRHRELENERISLSPEVFEAKMSGIRREMSDIALYCIQDSELLLKLVAATNLIINLTELASIVRVNPIAILNAGQTARCISQIYYECVKRNTVINKREIEIKSFKGGFVADPKQGLFDRVLCWDCASMYPSIIRALNIDYTTLIKEEIIHLLEKEDYYDYEFDQEEVGEKEDESDGVSGKEEEEVDDDDDEEPGDEEENAGDKKKKKKKKEKKPVVVKHYRYLWYKKREGILPKLSKELVNERNAVRKNMKKLDEQVKLLKEEDNRLAKLLLENDPSTIEERERLLASAEERSRQIFLLKNQLAIMEAVQLGLKVSGNSIYGFIGASFGLPLPEGSRTVTAMGREVINHVTEYIVREYQGTRIYGDTDSTMIEIPSIQSADQCEVWGHKIADEINNGIAPGGLDALGRVVEDGRPPLLPSPMRIEYEKGMRMLPIKKKKYAALLYNPDGSFKQENIMDEKGILIGKREEMMTKGIVIARRDNCEYLRDIYSELIYDVLHKAGFYESYAKLFASVEKLLDRTVPLDKLIIIKSCRSNYKKDSNPMNIFINYLRSVGKSVNPGDRLEHVIVEGQKGDKVGARMRLPEQYLERLNTAEEERIDSTFYIKHMMNALDQLLGIGYKNEIDFAKTITSPFRISNRHKALHVDESMKIMFKLSERGDNPRAWKAWFDQCAWIMYSTIQAAQVAR